MSDYKFDWNRVTSLKGVSGVYMLMTYARLSSLLRTADAYSGASTGSSNIAECIELNWMTHFNLKEMICDLKELNDASQAEEQERIALYAKELILHLEKYELTLGNCVRDMDPFHLCMYLYNLCRILSKLYKVAPCADPTLDVPAHVRHARVECFRSGLTVLHHGLRLMGITPLQTI